MRFFFRNRVSCVARAVACIVVFAAASTLMMGCGSSHPAEATDNYYDRSYLSSSITTGSYNFTGKLALVVSKDGTAVGSLVLLGAAPTSTVAPGPPNSPFTAPLKGTFDNETGAFALSGGTYTVGSITTGFPITMTGTLPKLPATTGGSIYTTIGRATFYTQFTGVSSLPVTIP